MCHIIVKLFIVAINNVIDSYFKSVLNKYAFCKTHWHTAIRFIVFLERGHNIILQLLAVLIFEWNQTICMPLLSRRIDYKFCEWNFPPYRRYAYIYIIIYYILYIIIYYIIYYIYYILYYMMTLTCWCCHYCISRFTFSS